MGRVRSYWAWGYEEKFPSVEVRRALAARLGRLFGTLPELGELPTLDDVTIEAPRYTPPVELRQIGTTDKRARLQRTYGRGFPDLVRGFTSDFAAAPDWIFSPSTEEHLQALFRFCESESIALVPYGGGTSVVGGVECRAGGRFRGTACVELSKMAAVLDVDAVSLTARIQAGASGSQISEQLGKHGLVLRHYPQSYEFSTLGGWLATRAGGHYATLRTHIDDLVQSIRMVTPSGVIETPRVPYSGAGPRPESFLLGSEGAFGIITEATVRVEGRPRWRGSATVHFSRFDEAVVAARALAQSGLHPANCRLFDEHEVRLHELAKEAGALLLLGFESADHPVEPWLERALSIATDLGGVCPDDARYTTDFVYSLAPRPSGARSSGPPASTPNPTPIVLPEAAANEAAHWKQSFFEAPYLQSALVSLGVICDTFETSCAWSRFAELHEAVTRATTAAMQSVAGGGLITCRFTHVYPDGPAPYYTFLAPGRKGAEIEQWNEIKRAATEAVLAAGGTTTHHHAVGRVHQAFWEKERSPAYFQVLNAAKERLDPEGILNPGCLLPRR